MSFYRNTLADQLPLTGATQYTPLIDCTNVSQGSFQITTQGIVGTPSITCALEGNDDVPPNGIFPGQPATNSFCAPWAPVEGHWRPLAQVDGSTPLSITVIATNTTYTIPVSPQELITRFVRVRLTAPVTGAGGTISCTAFLRGNN